MTCTAQAMHGSKDCTERGSLAGGCGSAAGMSFKADSTRPATRSVAGRPKQIITAGPTMLLEPAAPEGCYREQAQTEKQEGYGVTARRILDRAS